MSNQDIIRKIEKILSDILSRKYDARIVIKFLKEDESSVEGNESKIID